MARTRLLPGILPLLLLIALICLTADASKVKTDRKTLKTSAKDYANR